MPELIMKHSIMLLEFESIKRRTSDLFSNTSEEVFNRKPNEDRWSAAECIAHLNLIAGGYINYFPVDINTRENLAKMSDDEYRTRKLSGWFISKMMPDSKIKLHTPSEYKAAESYLSKSILTDFEKIQDRFIHLLQRASFDELKSRKIRSPFSPLIKFQLGELFILHIGHQKRHLIQAQNALLNY